MESSKIISKTSDKHVMHKHYLNEIPKKHINDFINKKIEESLNAENFVIEDGHDGLYIDEDIEDDEVFHNAGIT
jgi:hypothetical protein